jgi:hypothetical protein
VIPSIQVDPIVSRALAANLCPFSGRRELASFAEDFCEPVGEAVEATARSAVWQGPAKHLEHMLSGKQRIDQTIEASSGSERRFRLRNKDAEVWNEPARIPARGQSAPRRDSAYRTRELWLITCG